MQCTDSIIENLAVKTKMVGTEWANSRPGCMSRLIKCHSHPLGGSFLAGKDCHGVNFGLIRNTRNEVSQK